MENLVTKTTSVSFSEAQKCNTQQSILSILKNHNYYFKRVTQYDNNMFYCVVLMTIENNTNKFLNHWFRTKLDDKQTGEFILQITVGDSNYQNIKEPMIFTREDVSGIVADVPENYVGAEVL